MKENISGKARTWESFINDNRVDFGVLAVMQVMFGLVSILAQVLIGELPF